MSERNVAVVRRLFEAWHGLDPDRALELFDDAVEWTPPQDEPETGTVHGSEGVQGLLLQWYAAFEDFHIEPREFVEVGEQVVVPQRITGRMRGSGMEVALEETHLFRLEDGKIVEVHGYRTTEEAMKAARG